MKRWWPFDLKKKIPKCVNHPYSVDYTKTGRAHWYSNAESVL
jgi:hypothetical protein